MCSLHNEQKPPVNCQPISESRTLRVKGHIDNHICFIENHCVFSDEVQFLKHYLFLIYIL